MGVSAASAIVPVSVRSPSAHPPQPARVSLEGAASDDFTHGERGDRHVAVAALPCVAAGVQRTSSAERGAVAVPIPPRRGEE